MFPKKNPNELPIGSIKKGKDNKMWLVVPNCIGHRYVFYKFISEPERKIQIHSLIDGKKTFSLRITKNHILIYPENDKDTIWLPNYLEVYYTSKDPNRILIEYKKINEQIQVVWIEGNILKSFIE